MSHVLSQGIKSCAATTILMDGVVKMFCLKIKMLAVVNFERWLVAFVP